MKKSIFFLKKLTLAEVGGTKTHEKYVRLPNDFDYESFFPGLAKDNGTVIQVDFSAKNKTVGHSSDREVALKFVFYAHSNQEKRIPSLGGVFAAHNIEADDVVCLESCTDNGTTTFYITFAKSSVASLVPAAVTYSIITDDDGIVREKGTAPTKEETALDTQEYSYISAIRTKPFLILGGFSGTGKSQKVKELAFATCPCDGVLNTSETSPGNYLLVSVKPNWHDATDITGFRSSVNKNYYVTDFMRFLVKAKQYEDKKIPFFVCLDEMNLAPVEEYFADFLSVIESRKRRKDGRIVTDALVPASVFNDDSYSADFNIFLKLGLQATNSEWKADDINALDQEEQAQAFVRQDIVEALKRDGLTIPQNVIIIGTVNMDDTTNSFSRKVIDRAMTFETIVGEFKDDYFNSDVALYYIEKPRSGELFISDEVRASQMLDDDRFVMTDKEKAEVLDFINNINQDLEGSPFKVSYRILNETILLYRSKKEIERIMNEGDGFEEGVVFSTDLNTIFDDILMQKVLPRIEGDYEKCSKALTQLLKRCEEKEWKKSEDKINFMIKRFGKDKSGFTSFWN